MLQFPKICGSWLYLQLKASSTQRQIAISLESEINLNAHTSYNTNPAIIGKVQNGSLQYLPPNAACIQVRPGYPPNLTILQIDGNTRFQGA